jgi:transposase
LPHLRTQIVKRSDQAKGFVVLPKRWIVERTLAGSGNVSCAFPGVFEGFVLSRFGQLEPSYFPAQN